METSKNVSKMSLAAIKAWETRRKHADEKAAGSSKKEKSEKTGKEKKEKNKVDSNEAAGMKADEQREMKALNGTELEQMAKKTQKKLDRKEVIENVKQGHQDKKAVSVGNIIKKAKIERFNGGVKVSGVQ
jgi:ATP-dependent phosphoenolpyruvate carboxykinase